MKFIVFVFMLFSCNVIFAQGNPKIEILVNGASIPKGDPNVLTLADIDYSLANETISCTKQKADFGSSTLVASITTKNTIAFSMDPFRDCGGVGLGNVMVLEIVVTEPTHPLYNYRGAVVFKYEGTQNYYGAEGLNLLAPSSAKAYREE